MEPVGLAELASKDELILTWNTTGYEKSTLNTDSPCTERLGLTADRLKDARNVLYYACDELGQPDHSPARILPDDLSVADVIEAFMAGPTEPEQAAGFHAGPYGPSGPVVVEEVEGVLVIDFLVDLPPSFTDFFWAQGNLAATILAPAESGKISVLEKHVPTCAIADLCA